MGTRTFRAAVNFGSEGQKSKVKGQRSRLNVIDM